MSVQEVNKMLKLLALIASDFIHVGFFFQCVLCNKGVVICYDNIDNVYITEQQMLNTLKKNHGNSVLISLVTTRKLYLYSR